MSYSHQDCSTFFHLLLLPTTATTNPAIPTTLLCLLLLLLPFLYFHPGGVAWALSKARDAIPAGPPGMVLAMSGPRAHRALAELAASCKATGLMAFSVGLTRFVVSSHPDTAREILHGAAFADRPVKESARELLFHRAMGFAPAGEYWRGLRRLSAAHMFSPRRVSALGGLREAVGEAMVRRVGAAMAARGVVGARQVLQLGSLDNVMASVFGVRLHELEEGLGPELEEMVREGYELLGAFNWGDHLPLLRSLDLQGVRRRCRRLVSRVTVFVTRIIEEHRSKQSSNSDCFVDVLLGLEGEEKLSDSDMVAVLWEMVFRGTDTVAILLEWILARMALHQDIQSKAQSEIDAAVGGGRVTDGDIPSLPYLQSVVKESLRMHPPGPLLSWARLAVHDARVGGRLVPAGTTAVVNMWAIARDGRVWRDPEVFRPERFMEEEVSIMGSDLRLAPFGAGRRVCPGKALGLATVHLWLAQLLRSFRWVPAGTHGVDLSECLKMTLEMKTPLVCMALPRT